MNRKIEAEIVVNASRAKVWKLWTTTEGIKAFIAPDARIELKIGGAWEWYFDPSAEEGSRGSEGCKVLSYLPEEMLSFSWNAPPSIPSLRNANWRNWVVVAFTGLSQHETKITLHHLGWGEGAAHDECFAYFSNAWPYVLEKCAEYCGG